MKNRIILLQPNVRMPDTGIYINHGLASVAGALRAKGYAPEIHIVTTDALKNGLPSIKERLRDCLLAGISVYSNQWGYAQEIAGIFKQAGVPVIGGGPHCSLFPEAISQTTWFDAFVVGEGEEVVCAIAACLASGKSIGGIKGVWVASPDRSILQNGACRPIESLDSLAEPAYDLYPHSIVNGYPGLMFSRGCPYNCSYCCNSAYRARMGSSKTRFLSVERAIERAVKYVGLFNPPFINFDDDTFTKNTQWVAAFLTLYRAKIGLPFNCNVRPETITPEVCGLLKQSGCSSIAMGVESGDEDIRRKVLSRLMTDKLILQAGSMIREAGLNLSTFNMTGLPGETLRSYWKTVAINRTLMPANLQMTVYYPFRGTVLGEYCYKNKLVRDEPSAASYFAPSVLRLPGFPRWQILLAQRLFKFLVFIKYAPVRAVFEIVKDCVKAIPGAYYLTSPYLATKKMFLTGLSK